MSAARVTRTQHSDGTWKVVTVERRHPILQGVGWFFGVAFVIGLCIQEWWYGFLIVGVIALAVWAGKHNDELEGS